MAELNEITNSEEIRNNVTKIQQNFEELEDRIGDATDGHDHDGTDSKKVAHSNTTGRTTTATSGAEGDCSHPAGAIYDTSQSATVQETLDDHESKFSTSSGHD
ncbi:MAG TPA: hypothetical protein PL019_09050, partial [Caldisericia bacterium]|nr:hypothetical protein [Caldisericia bacterium]